MTSKNGRRPVKHIDGVEWASLLAMRESEIGELRQQLAAKETDLRNLRTEAGRLRIQIHDLDLAAKWARQESAEERRARAQMEARSSGPGWLPPTMEEELAIELAPKGLL